VFEDGSGSRVSRDKDDLCTVGIRSVPLDASRERVEKTDQHNSRRSLPRR
jgi:hypothetical protein